MFVPGLYDVHAHLADSRLSAELPAILQRCADEMQAVLVNAARQPEWQKVLEIAQKPGMYAALGLHPFFLHEASDDWLAQLEKLVAAELQSGKLIAIGEIGLDCWDGRKQIEQQKNFLRLQLELAHKFSLPVILHNRRAWPDFFGLLKELRCSRLLGVCHHFNASRQIAKQALDLGLYISFCGPLTYTQSNRLRELAKYIPADRLLVETDCPDLPPQSQRGAQSRPWMVEEIMHCITELRRVSMSTLQEQIADNWQSLFGKQIRKVFTEIRKRK
ncbi:MAG: TatD family hydrolase [Oligosphaeraceae bacterium]|nr:TatD family hydrolase [Oligosphaeraceae bacterium]